MFKSLLGTDPLNEIVNQLIYFPLIIHPINISLYGETTNLLRENHSECNLYFLEVYKKNTTAEVRRAREYSETLS